VIFLCFDVFSHGLVLCEYTKMNNPFVRILFAIIFLFIVFGLYLLFNGEPLGTLFLIPLGAVIGIPMGLAFPFSVSFKLGYIAALVGSIVVIIWGLVKRKAIWGQVLVVLGIIAWLICGLLGLGTGT
jgi:hypothetical protein